MFLERILKMSFIHLHTHTQYSIHDAMNKIDNYVKRCKELGMEAAAITDHGVMYGAIEFYHACEKENIKPIIGCEVYVAPKSRFEKDNKNRYNHLVLLAKNNNGYNNICQIVTEGCVGDGFYYRPRVDDEILEKYHEDIICLSACIAGRIPQDILSGDIEKAKEDAIKYRDMFGDGNFYLELQDHGIEDQKTVINGLMRIHNETGIPLVATNDCHYTYKEDAEAHDVLLCLADGKLVSDEDRQKDTLGQWYVKSEEEMKSLFPYAPEAIDNSKKIADMCNVELEFHNTKMPKCPLPEGKTAEEHLHDVCEKGFNIRYADKSEDEKKKLREDMEYQLSVIKQMGYIEYFLIVQEYCNWARDNGIAVGPGRGSAAGSIVTYCTGITDIEPTQYDLQFERFLNPERVSTPDVDIDFDIRGRGDVVEHCKKIYGEDNVVQIITFGRMETKAVLKDVGKALGFSYEITNSLTKLIPGDVKNLKMALETVPDFKKLYDEDESIKNLIDMSMRLEGLPKSTGTHAAGVIISDRPTRDYIPLTRTADRTGVVSQYTMTYVEELGLLKMDFLGLRTLTVIEDARENIRKSHGIDVDLKKIDYEDKDVYQFISSGMTNGVFQLESKGMQGFMKNLKPGCLEDIIAGVALYRPGPMDFIPQYIENKNSGKEVVYDTPELEPILRPTYGCIVYQEQVTQIVRDLAGYSMGAADNIRRAMSKKKQYVIDEERKSFVYGDPKRDIPGCVKNGISEDIANRIYDHMVDFAKYAFNKSHAACYGVIAYQTAWLMYHYPVEYFAAIETSVIGNSDKLTAYMQAAKLKGIQNIRPDINRSGARFSVEDGKIRMALCAVSAVSDDTARLIEDDRNKKGDYKDITDVFDRLSALKIGADAIENLIYAGATDTLPGNRRQKVSVCRSYIDNKKKSDKNTIDGQMTLFDIMPTTVSKIVFPDVCEYGSKEILLNEKKSTGIYISGHPLDNVSDLIRKNTDITSNLFSQEEDGEYNVDEDQKVSMVCLLTDVKKHYTKKGDAMAFIEAEDLYGAFSVVVFPKLFEKHKNMGADDIVILKGHIAIDDTKGLSIIADDITSVDEMPKKLWIKFPSRNVYERSVSVLDLIKAGGHDNVVIYLEDTKERWVAKNFANIDSALEERVRAMFGSDNIAITR